MVVNGHEWTVIMHSPRYIYSHDLTGGLMCIANGLDYWVLIMYVVTDESRVQPCMS